MGKIIAVLKELDLLGFTIAAVVSLFVSLVYRGLSNLVVTRRKSYNISRQTINHTIYENRNDGDLSISVSYKGKMYEDVLTLIRIRLLNDGENDIIFMRKCAKPVIIEVDDSIELVDAFCEPSNKELDASIINNNGKCNLIWTLLKKDEYIDVVIVAKGKDVLPENIKIIARIDGVGKIKSPEYKVWPKLWPFLAALSIVAVVMWFSTPAQITFIPGVHENIFWMGIIVLMASFFIVTILLKRIKWLKE